MGSDMVSRREEHRVHHLYREPAHGEGRGYADAAPYDRAQDREGQQAQDALGNRLERPAVGLERRDPDQPLQLRKQEGRAPAAPAPPLSRSREARSMEQGPTF